jgi:hypothetical protein
MRSLTSGLVTIAVAGLVGAVALAGCSADGGSADLGLGTTTEQDPTERTPSGGAATLPPPSQNTDGTDGEEPGSSSGSSSGGGKTDAGKDAGPPPPTPGTACTTVDEIAGRSCGKCGKQEAICEEVDSKLQWSGYGSCGGETGSCVPGDTQECGNCGTQTCTQYCGWGACTGQPQNHCAPGAVEHTSAGCATGGYKNRTCGEACTWGNFSAACEIPTTGNKMTIQGTVGAVRSAQWELLTETTKKPNTSCNGSLSSVLVRYVPVEVSNPTTKTAEITVYQSKSPSGRANTDLDIWTYATHELPMTDADRGKCVGKVEDYCLGTNVTNNICGNTTYNWYFAAAEKVTIPPGGKILVYSAQNNASTEVGNGTFMLNLRTDKLQ